MVPRSAVLLASILLLVSSQIAESSYAGPKAFDASRQDAEAAIAAAQAYSEEAFLHIHEVDRVGGNVTALAVRFNEALELVDRARMFIGDGLANEAVISAESAQGIFKGLGSEAEVLGIQAASEASARRTAVLLAAPVIVTLMTVLSYLLIRSWQRRRMERTMEMEVREAETP